MGEYGLGSTGATLAARLLGTDYIVTNEFIPMGPFPVRLVYPPPNVDAFYNWLTTFKVIPGSNFPYGHDVEPNVHM